MRRIPFLPLLLFLLIGLGIDRGLGLLLDHLFSRVYSGQNSGGSIRLALEHPERQVMVLGSSRALHHVVPEVLEAHLPGLQVHNAGNGGHGIYYARMLQALLLERPSALRLIVLQVDVKDLYGADPARDLLFAPFYGQNPDVDAILQSSGRWAPLKLQLRTYRYNSMLLPMLSNLDLPGARASSGFVPLHGSMEGKPKQAREPAGSTASHPIEPEVVQTFREFFAAAAARGVALAMTFGPRYREPGAASLEEVEGRRLLAALADAHGAAVLPMDEIEYPELLEGALYQDSAHLNEAGARRYTALLAERLLHDPITAAALAPVPPLPADSALP